MLKYFFLNKWTFLLLLLTMVAVMVYFGLRWQGGVLFFGIAAFAIMKSAYKEEIALGKAYLTGVMVGTAALCHPYAFVLLPLLLIYMYGAAQAHSIRMTLAMLLGVLSPFWLYLPYWLYVNTSAFTDIPWIIER